MRIALWIATGAQVLLLLPLAAALLYFYYGSVDPAPTAAQQHRVRLVMGLLITALLFAEGALYILRRRWARSRSGAHPAEPGDVLVSFKP